MSTNTTEGLSPYDGSTVSEIVESYTETVEEALESAEADKSALSAVEEAGDALHSKLEEVAEEARQAHARAREAEQRADDLEDELADLREEQARERADDRKRLTDVEDTVEEIEDAVEADPEGSTPTPEADETTIQRPDRTPLERVVALDEEDALRELTSNQERARFVAADVTDYARSCPAGHVIESSDLSTILAAKEDGTPHRQTVSRVLDFLDRLGKDDVEVVKRRGTRRVVFSEDLVERLGSIEDEADPDGPVTGVVTGGG